MYMAIFDITFTSSSFRAIWQAMCLTIEHFDDSLQIQYPLKTISKSFYWKISLQILLVSAGLLAKYYICSNAPLSLSEIVLTIVFVYKCVHLSHITIYIDFTKIAITCLCEKIVTEYRENHSDDQNDLKNIEFMRQIELTYFKIWRISDGVNRQFGWFLATFPIDIIIIVVHAFYWITVDLLTSGDNVYAILCKIFDQYRKKSTFIN